MEKKLILLILIVLVFQSNCAHSGFSGQVASIIDNQTLSASELKELIDSENDEYILIDVRSKSEYDSGHIPTAVNIPHTKIQENIKKIPSDKLVIVYCKVGARAGAARDKLLGLGYKDVINFGGTYSWNYELVK